MLVEISPECTSDPECLVGFRDGVKGAVQCVQYVLLLILLALLFLLVLLLFWPDMRQYCLVQ